MTTDQSEQDKQREDEDYEVCIYCGMKRPSNPAKSCCGEMHFELLSENERRYTND